MGKVIRIKTTIRPTGGWLFSSMLTRLTFDPWILTLALGALGHQLEFAHILFRFGFWQCVLICVAIQAVSPAASIPKLIMEEKGISWKEVFSKANKPSSDKENVG